MPQMIRSEWLKSTPLQQVMDAIIAGGYRAFLVGGCVRNALLNRTVADIDIATDAPPDQVIALSRAAGLTPVPTGIEHGTVTVVAHGIPHEVTTFRRDIDTDGRHATVAFSTRIEDDAIRRDFTMNALYADRNGHVIDPLGEGLRDLARGHLRFVGDPDHRIREDYLRILRFFRFTALYGNPDLGLDAEGLAACAALAEGMAGVSRERIGHEMRRLLAAPDPATVLAAMSQSGVLARVLPGSDSRSIAPLVHFEAGLAPDFIRRLAALGAPDAADALRLSKAEARRLDVIRTAALGTDGPAVLGYHLGLADATSAWLVRAALIGAPPVTDGLARIAFGAAQTFPVKAADLIPHWTGPALGQRLKDLESRWIMSEFTLDRGDLLA